MKVDNPVSGEFLTRYPVEAARVLEQVSSEDVAALFGELSTESIVPVLGTMLPNMAASCLSKMGAQSAAKLLTELPATSAAQIYKLIPATRQKELSDHLSDKTRSRIYRFLDYIPLSAGDLMGHVVTMLPGDLTVADAIRRIEHVRHTIGCEIFIIDNEHRLLGVIEAGRLLTSSHHARLREMVAKKTYSVSVHTKLEKLLSHPGWTTQHRLPVVERDNTLVGILDYKRLKEATGERDISAHDPLGNLFSLAELYWLSLLQLLDSILSTAHREKGK